MLDRPVLPLGRLPVNLLRREGVEGVVVGRVHRDELAWRMGGELGDRQAVPDRDSRESRRNRSSDEAALSRSMSRPSQVGNLHALVAEPGRPAAHAVQRVERRLVAGELRQEDRRTLHEFAIA